MKLAYGKDQRLKFFLNVLVILLSFFVLSRERFVFKKNSAFENFMIDSLAPIQREMAFIQRTLKSIFTHYFDNISASKENKVLKKEIAFLENRIFTYEEIERENKRLKKMLRFGKGTAWKKILAQIVGWDASSDFRVLRINKGMNEGIRLESTVVTNNGLVGYVYRLSDHFSDILTILDPNNRMDGIVQRTRTLGILEGYSSGKCLMKYVAGTELIILNDIVLTSGLGNIYPKGLVIGRVSKIERESYGVTQRIEVAPTVDFNKLEEVVVLVSDKKQVKKKEWNLLDSFREK